MVVLDLQNIVKTFAQPGGEPLRILSHLDLRIEEASTTSIVGQSGSGKSTLLHIMGLMDTPTSGDVLISGRSTIGMSEAERSSYRGEKLGFVFQHFYLLNRRSVLQNVMEPLFWGDRSTTLERTERAKELIERVGLGHRLHAVPHTLSGGERQRVAIARALVRRPHVLLADEPTGSLDVRTSESITKILFETTEQLGTALVLVTHDPSIASLARNTYMLRDGQLREEK